MRVNTGTDTKCSVDNISLTQEMADLKVRRLTDEQRGYLRKVFSEKGRSTWYWGNRSTDDRIHGALTAKGLLVDGSFRKLTDLGERTCCVLFPELTPEGVAARRRENGKREFAAAVEHYQRRLVQWQQQRLALAEEFAAVAIEHGTDLGFGLPLRLTDVVLGAQPSAPVPSDYGIEVES